VAPARFTVRARNEKNRPAPDRTRSHPCERLLPRWVLLKTILCGRLGLTFERDKTDTDEVCLAGRRSG